MQLWEKYSLHHCGCDNDIIFADPSALKSFKKLTGLVINTVLKFDPHILELLSPICKILTSLF